MPEVTEIVLPFLAARALVEREAATLVADATERLGLREAVGRVLAEQIHADRDLPPFDRSTRDGYAVRAADVNQLPVRLKIIGEIAAGFAGKLPQLQPGECVAIMTGAPVPPGADAVVMIEHTRLEGTKQVIVERSVSSRENVVSTGAEARRGDALLAPRAVLDFAAVSVAATVGAASVQVYRKPRIAILSTGDEVVSVEHQPGPFEIRNSNAWSLAAQVERAGGEPVVLDIARDDFAELKSRVGEGLGHDLLLLSGGVSMGKHDLVEKVLAEFQAEFFFTGVLIQPGKPAVFGRAGGRYFVGLPGNPLSTMVCFELFARPLIEALAGMPPRPLRYLKARLRAPLKVKAGLMRFLPARLTGAYAEFEAHAMPWQGSGDVVTMAHADGWIVTEKECGAGDIVDFLLK